MRTLLPIVVALTAVATAQAAPAPFAVYVVPNMSIDVYPISNAARAAQRAAWQGFLRGGNDDWSPSAHITSVRLTDLERPDGTPYGGWRFSVVVPLAPSPWKAPDLHIAIDSVDLDGSHRDIELGSLLVGVILDRTQLEAGKHVITATQGKKVVFSLELALEDGAADDPEPISKSRALYTAATKQPPFLVAAIPERPDCSMYPPAAGCTRGITKMWRELFVGTLANHPHVTRFARMTKTSIVSNVGQLQWPAYLVFPTPPANWTQYDPEITLDGKPVPAPHLRFSDTEALVIELKLFAGAWTPGKHQLRAVSKAGTVLFASPIELAP